MTIAKPHMITEAGLVKLTEELEYLSTEGRERIADRLHNAFQDGQDDDFVENAELEAARNELSFLEGRIQELNDILGHYQLISESIGPHDTVWIGDWVTVLEDGYAEEERYHLVGPAEADPVEGRISYESPLGKALLGSKVSEKVRVNAPNGLLEFTIVSIG
ncbi:MAG TPA: transcription elongation factor GreA [candidate division Zixibacteria bacterium]|nr:transcription elongation factor GreA [candidate division Zixibacteria bacterium]